VAELLGTTTAAVNSMLQRAHAQIDEAAPTPESVTEPTEAAQRELLDRYVAAFEANDYKAITELFAQDAVWEMPPFLDWFRGGQHIGQLIEHHCPAKAAGDMRLLPTQANGQPAFGLYMRTREGDFEAFNLPVLTLGPDGVTHVVAFFDVHLFDTFGLPRRLPSDPPTS
jgi:RNA polymerase sigma-70 factor (ECF subfamily)